MAFQCSKGTQKTSNRRNNYTFSPKTGKNILKTCMIDDAEGVINLYIVFWVLTVPNLSAKIKLVWWGGIYGGGAEIAIWGVFFNSNYSGVTLFCAISLDIFFIA